MVGSVLDNEAHAGEKTKQNRRVNAGTIIVVYKHNQVGSSYVNKGLMHVREVLLERGFFLLISIL